MHNVGGKQHQGLGPGTMWGVRKLLPTFDRSVEESTREPLRYTGSDSRSGDGRYYEKRQTQRTARCADCGAVNNNGRKRAHARGRTQAPWFPLVAQLGPQDVPSASKLVVASAGPVHWLVSSFHTVRGEAPSIPRTESRNSNSEKAPSATTLHLPLSSSRATPLPNVVLPPWVRSLNAVWTKCTNSPTML